MAPAAHLIAKSMMGKKSKSRSDVAAEHNRGDNVDPGPLSLLAANAAIDPALASLFEKSVRMSVDDDDRLSPVCTSILTCVLFFFVIARLVRHKSSRQNENSTAEDKKLLGKLHQTRKSQGKTESGTMTMSRETATLLAIRPCLQLATRMPELSVGNERELVC